MAAKLKVDELESVDGSTNLILNNSVTMASGKTLPAASLTGNLPAISAANLTAIPAGNLTGTVADARISALTASKLTGALPAISAANLTAIPAANITGTLPAISGVNLTALNATNLGSGTVPTARLGSGTASNSVFLRGDGSWQTAGSTSASDLTSGTLPMARLSGTLPALNGSALTDIPGGLSEADQWRLTSNVTLGNDLVSWLTANWERVDTDGFGKLGTGLTESSGVFSFPSTGVWLITFNVNGHCFNTNTRYYNATVYTTTDNSTYDSASLAQTNGYNSGSGTYLSASCTFIFDVTNVSTHKFKMQVLSIGGGFVQSSSTSNRTSITAIKLGDT